MSQHDVGTFDGAVDFVTDQVLPVLAEEYPGPFHPFFTVFATVDADDNPCEPACRKVKTDFEFATDEAKEAFADAARDLMKAMGAIGFVFIVDTAAAELGDDLVIVWLDHVRGSKKWVAKIENDRVGEFVEGEYDFGPHISRLLPPRWMN